MWPEKTLDKKKSKGNADNYKCSKRIDLFGPKKKRELIYKDYLICQIAGTEPLFL